MTELADLRITYLHQYFNTPAQSGGTRSFEMARRLVEKGHSVSMVASDRSRKQAGFRGSRTIEAGIDVHWIPVEYSNRMSFARRIQAFAEFAARASATAARIPADVVFATSTPLTIGIPGVRAARAQRVPLVFEVRDLWPSVPIAVGALKNPISIASARALEKWTYRNSARIVALSPGMAEGVAASGYPSNQIIVIPNACDLSLFERGSRDPFLAQHPELSGRRLVVYAGTLGLINDVEYLVRVAAASLHQAPDVAFVVVGDGAMLSRTRDLAREMQVLGRNTYFYPPVPKSAMPDVLAAADLCVSLVMDNPAMAANSANKFFDALAAGRPIGINYGGWQADLIEGRCGLRISRNAGEASSQIIDLVRDDTRLRDMGRAASELAVSDFHRDDLAAKLECVLREAAEEARSAKR